MPSVQFAQIVKDYDQSKARLQAVQEEIAKHDLVIQTKRAEIQLKRAQIQTNRAEIEMERQRVLCAAADALFVKDTCAFCGHPEIKVDSYGRMACTSCDNAHSCEACGVALTVKGENCCDDGCY
jgi:hypothetical protein